MTLKQALDKLKSLAHEKVRLQNKKSGADDNQYGVKNGDIRTIAKAIKTDKALAMELWETGNLDAQQLAILIIKPKDLSVNEIEKMIKSIRWTGVADWFNSYIIKEHPDKEIMREKWMKSKDPFSRRAGWSLTAGRVAREPEGLEIPGLLDRIEKEMPKAPPEVQWTMNSTLANIGIHHPSLRKKALAIGEKLGIYRDYPTPPGCTSPFAPIWINEMVKRQK